MKNAIVEGYVSAMSRKEFKRTCINSGFTVLKASQVSLNEISSQTPPSSQEEEILIAINEKTPALATFEPRGVQVCYRSFLELVFEKTEKGSFQLRQNLQSVKFREWLAAISGGTEEEAAQEIKIEGVDGRKCRLHMTRAVASFIYQAKSCFDELSNSAAHTASAREMAFAAKEELKVLDDTEKKTLELIFATIVGTDMETVLDSSETRYKERIACERTPERVARRKEENRKRSRAADNYPATVGSSRESSSTAAGASYEEEEGEADLSEVCLFQSEVEQLESAEVCLFTSDVEQVELAAKNNVQEVDEQVELAAKDTDTA